MSINRKIPSWPIIAIAVFVISLGVITFWASRLHWQEVRAPAELCLSKEFPGKSIPLGELDSESWSVFNDKEFGSEPNDKFYLAVQEERFEKAKFEDENSYPELTKADEIYRFSWLRTFHNPYIFRVYRIGDDKFIVAKGADGRSGYDLGKVIINKTRKLSDSEWCEFIDLLDRADFWNKKKIDVNTLANDGAFWNIEGVRERRFYVTGEQSPREGRFRDACIYLMRVSGLSIDENAREFY